MSEGSSQPIQLVDKAPKWKGENVENWAAKFRGKTNLSVSDEKGLFGSLFSKSAKKIEGQRDNIAGLQKEFYLLHKLKDSGVTPEPLMLKTNPDKTEAHVLMKKVEGESFEKSDKSDETITRNFGNIAESVSESIDAVHSKGVLVVDINEGTFVMDGIGNKDIKTHVVDFELGEDMNDLSSSEVKSRVTKWYAGNDMGMRIATRDVNFHLDVDTARKAEQYLGAKSVVEHFVGSDFSWKFDRDKLSVEDRARYDAQLKVIQPKIDDITHEKLQEDYKRAKEAKSAYIPPDEKTHVEKEFNNALQTEIGSAMINITLPYFLRDKGISVEQPVLEQLQKRLSPIVSERPSLGSKKQAIVDRIDKDGDEDKVLSDIAKNDSET